MVAPARFNVFFFIFSIVLGFSVAGGRAAAENRVALVIGQSAYKTVPALTNPANDAKLTADMLQAAGFDVKTALDLSQNEMRQVIGDFAAKIAGRGADTVALLYYAGHGLQIDGENYLVPVDVTLDRESDVPLQAVRLNDVMNTVASVPTKMRIIMLDACRNDPFNSINKIAGHGLALVDTKANAAGSFVSFSTSPGTEALDGSGANSPYASALAVSAREPGIAIEDAFKKVRLAVNKSTDGQQIPWESSSLTSDFYFFPGTGQAKPGSKTGTRTVADWRQLLRGQDPQAGYDLVVADDSVEGYQAFVELYPQSAFVTRLKVVIERRREMITWSGVVFANTPGAYRAFLASYPNSDLAATARKLLERALNRPLNATAAATSNPTGGAPNNAGPNGPQQASLAGPTCPCTQPNQPPARSTPPPRRVDVAPPPRRPPPDVVYRRGPSPEEEAAIIGGAAIGGALLGGAFGGGGGRMRGHDY